MPTQLSTNTLNVNIELTNNISQLYIQNHRWLVMWLQKKLCCPFDAADLAHDTFIKLALTETECATIRTPRAFLTTTATRLMIDLIRRRRIEASYLDMLEQQQNQHLAATPEQIQQTIQTLDEIARLLQGLPEKVTQAFLLCRLDGLTYAEIAQELGVSTSRVKQYIAQAMLHCYKASYPTP